MIVANANKTISNISSAFIIFLERFTKKERRKITEHLDTILVNKRSIYKLYCSIGINIVNDVIQ